MKKSRRTIARLFPYAALTTALFIGSAANAAGALPAAAATATESEVDILDELRALPGVEVEEGVADAEGYRLFYMTFDQVADHHNPDGERFEQRLVLLHRDAAAPLILHTQGYNVSGYGQPIDLARNLGANELRVEHRFFQPSRPDSEDWSLLNIEQAAGDHHRITEIFREVYDAPWISTGFSKGGMTAMYFRRFYPNDVDATVAYVAPNSFGRQDQRYIPFLNTVGSAKCRRRLREYQKETLRRRDDIVPLIEEWAEMTGYTFSALPEGANQALDIAVAEAFFSFWQYGAEEFCDFVPLPDASDEELLGFLSAVGTLDFTADQILAIFQPWFVQANQQLGYPHLNTGHLHGLLVSDPNDYEPYGLGVSGGEFDWWPMIDMYYWAAGKAKKVLMIYGDHDPWTAGAFDLNKSAAERDSYKLVVAGGNHGADISGLSPEDRATAIDALERWSGATWTEPAPESRARPTASPYFLPAVHGRLSSDELEGRIQRVLDRHQGIR